MKVKASLLSFLVLLSLIFGFASLAFAGKKSVAREWNELVLSAIRKDYARPTVAARNLYYLSILAYDGWAMYEPQVKNFYYSQKHSAQDTERAREITITIASYRLVMSRFQRAPQFAKISAEAQDLARRYQVDIKQTDISDDPLGYGNQLAEMVISLGLFDGSREEQDYETPPLEFVPLNRPLIVKLPGVGSLANVNFWQPLALDLFIDQGGNPLPMKVQLPLTLHWAAVTPFALTASDRNPKSGLYFDPGMPPLWNGEGHAEFVQSMVKVIEVSSWLDPADKVKIDISPRSFGNSSLGANDGKGHQLNPYTGKPYAQQIVARGDYARVLAEFWADGPQSETPPGHWNVVANQVCESPGFKKSWMGVGEVLSDLEWDVRMYLTLNGALHDTAISVWGIKGYYQGSRPLTAVRYLGSLGQSSHPDRENYHSLGLPLVPNLIEQVTIENTVPGQKMAHLVGHEGEIAIKAWQGAPALAGVNKGVGWVLAVDWVPYQKPTFVTPPFPGYVSGHSAFSRAAAEVLTAITGNAFFPQGMGEYFFKKDSFLSFEQGPSEDLKLQWATYADAADQSAISRIIGGIHGSLDDFPSRKIGFKVGRKAVAKANRLYAQ